MSGPVVVGYTATKPGRDAVVTGARLARATNVPLEVVLVLPAEERSVITPPNAGYDRYLRDQAQAWLEDAVSELPSDLSAHTQARYADSFAEGLIDAADAATASFIVVGAADGGLRGRHRLGTTASELVHSSDVPVVLVPRGARRIGADTGVSRLTAAIGTRPGADALQEETIALSTQTGAPVRLVSLVTVDLPATVDTGVIRIAGAAHADEVLTRARAELSEAAVEEVVVGGGESIEDAVAQLDWQPEEFALVGSSRLAQPRRLFLGSTAAKMLHELPVPMIVVPRTRRGVAA